ncbi:MAG: peptide chain release factor N(5)-glutamine methyltransferase [Sphingomonas bacterium]|nr:peptide chain release factor N(5)-glutamine methyltransferase [Sphingomonas bacterium]
MRRRGWRASTTNETRGVNPLNRALADATDRLRSTSDTARLDAELLMAHALDIERDVLLLALPGGAAPAHFRDLVERRAEGEPVAYITGRRAFWNIELSVGPGALIPRPDSETLIAAAIGHFAGTDGPKRILDLGTGPGTLLLAALDQWPAATGLGIDASDEALDYARANARRLGLAPRAELRTGNWANGINERFDLLLINPPYVADQAELGPGVAEYEPAEALFAGPDGLDDYRRLAPEIGRLIAPGGLAAIEIGHDQAESAAALFNTAGHDVRLSRDLAGRARALLI